jgi:hypothetical protein
MTFNRDSLYTNGLRIGILKLDLHTLELGKTILAQELSLVKNLGFYIMVSQMYKESFNKAASVSILKIEKGKLGIFT